MEEAPDASPSFPKEAPDGSPSLPLWVEVDFSLVRLFNLLLVRVCFV